ncbi:MAG: hypothetical protein IKH77_08775 [Clostridia bacterium]|nr:hypothetical protein [Clostridia bacterium]
MKKLLALLLALCVVIGCAGASAEDEPVDLSYFRENSDVYIVTDMDQAAFVTSALSPGLSFPLPDWGEDSYAEAYFAVVAFDDGDAQITVPMLVVNVYTARKRDIRSLTIRVEDQDFTFSWQDKAQYAEMDPGFCQYIKIYLGQENIPFIEAMTAKGTSVRDPKLLLDMPVEIIFHGDEDCAAIMNEGAVMDYILVMYAGFSLNMDGLNRYMDNGFGTAMTMRAAGESEAQADEPQPITPEILIGLWELDHVDYSGMTLTAEDWVAFFGENASMEFTADGIWIMKSGGRTDIYFYEFVDGELMAEGEEAPLALVDGKLVFDVGSGAAMTLAKTDKPSLVPDTPVDEALLGTWYFEKLIETGTEFPEGMLIASDFFPVLYRMPNPTLEVVKVGYAVMQLGEIKAAFPVEEWHLEDGRLAYTQNFDDGTIKTWYFVRTEAEAALVMTPGYNPETFTPVETQPADDAPAATVPGSRFSYHGAAWGMTKAEVKALIDMEPLQEPAAASGHSALVYQINGEDGFRLVQYNFLPSGALYNIQIMAPDEDGSFYAAQQSACTALYGDPMPETGADIHSDGDPVAVMMAALMQSSADSDFLGWRADDETVIIMSRHASTCYVEIRRYTDYFRFE